MLSLLSWENHSGTVHIELGLLHIVFGHKSLLKLGHTTQHTGKTEASITMYLGHKLFACVLKLLKHLLADVVSQKYHERLMNKIKALETTMSYYYLL